MCRPLHETSKGAANFLICHASLPRVRLSSSPSAPVAPLRRAPFPPRRWSPLTPTSFFRPRSSRCYSRFRMSATSTGPSNSRPKRRAAATSAEHSSSASPRSAKRNRKPAAAPPVVVLRRDGDLVECEDGRWRCSWAVSAADYVKYISIKTLPRAPYKRIHAHIRHTCANLCMDTVLAYSQWSQYCRRLAWTLTPSQVSRRGVGSTGAAHRGPAL